MKNLAIFLFFLFYFNSDAQQSVSLDCAVKLDSSTIRTNVEVFIFSDPRCGFCYKAIKDIGEWAIGKSVSVIAMDLSGKPESVEQLEPYLKYNIEVRDASQCGEKAKKFIPKIYIREAKTNKQILKLRGWHSKDLTKMNKKLKRYL